MGGWIDEWIRRGIIDTRILYSSGEVKCDCGVGGSGDGAGVEINN